MVATLLFFMSFISVAIAYLRNLFSVVILTGIFSLLGAASYVVMDAVDVAFTEAAVGAGVSTVLMLSTLAITDNKEKVTPNINSFIALILVLITGIILVYGTFDMPLFGDASAPVHHHVAPRYIEESFFEIGLPNIVTSILASYRGYDTLGEAFVIFTATIGVWAIIGRSRRVKKLEQSQLIDKKIKIDLEQKVILRVVSKFLVPFILLFALYVQWHGDFGPGGGFQAGVIFASGFILYSLIFGVDRVRKITPPWLMRKSLVLGVLLYSGVGVITMFLGGSFLEYSVLFNDPLSGQHLGVLLIEFGVGLTVFSAMLSIFATFSSQDRN